MTPTWGPSTLGRLVTASKPWRIWLRGEDFRLQLHTGQTLTGSLKRLEALTLREGVIWASLRVDGKGGPALSLGGIANADARRLYEAIRAGIDGIRRRERLAQLRASLGPASEAALAWASGVRRTWSAALRRRGWITQALVDQAEAARPAEHDEVLQAPELNEDLRGLPPTVQAAISRWRQPATQWAEAVNEHHLAQEAEASREFLATVEKSPLTAEQARAVMCFDSRMLLVAAAGSGKTSTMVAKAGYALKKGYFAADKVLLLAFNNDAAAELRDRIRARLAPRGLPAEEITAKTFHAFGLDVIGQATGKRPTVAAWVESGQDIAAMLEMAQGLRAEDPAFRLSWDLFRLVFGQDLPRFGKEQDNPESWDRDSGRNGFWTLNNEVVRSRGEQVIANWLFYNGVRYQYEAPYLVDTADPEHRQYRPDFYLPDIDTYYEHWAVDAKGEPPADFEGYKQGMAWKREIHRRYGTKLIETTMAQLWSGQAFEHLARELTGLGQRLDPDPERPVPGRQPIEGARLARTVRAMLSHVKGNRLELTELRARAQAGEAGPFQCRHMLFLDLFERLWQRWQAKLAAEQCIDFDDMLNQAADLVEQGRWSSPYELVMADEFQDSSQARARLLAALVAQPGRCLFAVGDDWQSINRFAGADLSAMTDFEGRFGKATILKLESTFRCPQALCDVSSQFVQKNPRQLRKQVKSAVADVPEPVRIVRVPDEQSIRAAVQGRVAELAAEARPTGRPLTVFVLGRYQEDRTYAPTSVDVNRVNVQFETVHASKGLEADHVIVPRVTSDTLGFPNRIVDDPVLLLAMPQADAHEFAEERRLFYVALTRARRTVTLITIEHKESVFISELVRDHRIRLVTAAGSTSDGELCPKCHAGFLVAKHGRYGPFRGCSTFPRCDHTEKAPAGTLVAGRPKGRANRAARR